MRFRSLSSVAVAFALLSSGCAAIRAASARDSYLQSAIVDQPIAKPIEQVWPAVKSVLFSKGASVAEVDDAFFAVKTTPYNDSSTKGQIHWYVANAQRIDANSCQIKIVYATESTATDGRKARFDNRDWQLELEVLRQVDSQKAAAIDAEAQSRYDTAYNAK